MQGPQKSITAGTLTPSGTFLAGAADGRIVAYDLSGSKGAGDVEYVSGASHASLVTGLVSNAEGALSVGFDDTLREINAEGRSMTCVSVSLFLLNRNCAEY